MSCFLIKKGKESHKEKERKDDIRIAAGRRAKKE
jgi:hypothetical protein